VISEAHKQADGQFKIHVKRKKITRKKPLPVHGNGCKQAQGHQLWAHMLTIKLLDSSKLSWKKIKFTSKKPLPVPAVAVNKLGPSAVSSQAHKQAIGHLKIYVKKFNFTRKKPLPVPAMVVSKPRAINCEHTCSPRWCFIDENWD
jgi:hypothetical protein